MADMATSRRVERALRNFRAAERSLELARDELHAAIVDAIQTGDRGTQAQLAQLTGYSRERIRQITREAERQCA